MTSFERPNHILSSDQFNLDFLIYMYNLTNTIRRFDKSKDGLLYLKSLLPHRRAMLYFTQPSTRTFLSFNAASSIVGMESFEIRDRSTSSELKGESIEDSLRTFSSYVDLIIMRSPVAGLCNRIADYLDKTPRSIPIINAGSGPDEHPTQALLDIYTLQRSLRSSNDFSGKTICFVGDLKRGRTVRSLAKLLTNFPGVRLVFCSPDAFKIEDDLRQYLKDKNCSFEETDQFEEPIASCDAIYMTRIQDEYDKDGESKTVDYSKFHLKESHLKIIKDNCTIMHPLPRRGELDPKIDYDPRAKYWRQERNGMWTRVALITMLLDADHHIVLPNL